MITNNLNKLNQSQFILVSLTDRLDENIRIARSPVHATRNLESPCEAGMPSHASTLRSQIVHTFIQALRGCSTVGRTVASNTRDLRFESQHWQKVTCQLHNVEKTKTKKKRPG